MLQEAVDLANPSDTLVLPSGVCLVARCDIAQGGSCAGSANRRHSALQVIHKSNLTLTGAPDGTSVLKLDPTPLRRADGYHAYCGDTHVLSIQLSWVITLRDFTIDGLDGELPKDTGASGKHRIVDSLYA
jgi:hypothetical protein